MFKEPSDHHSSLILSRTCEATALLEVHALHAHGEHELVDGACGREGEARKKEKGRMRKRARLSLKNVFNQNDVQGTPFRPPLS